MARLTKGRQGPVLVGDIGALIPVSRRERGWYAAVAVSAGIGEELVFRGFFLRLLNDLGLDGLALVVVAGVIFGLAHVCQGVAGVLMTTVIGILLGLIYIATGSLLVAMLVHALMDLRLLLLTVPAAPEHEAAGAADPS